MPQSADGQDTRSESPADQPEQLPVDAQHHQQPAAADDANASQTPAPETSTAPEADSTSGDRPRDAQGRFVADESKPSTPDPVKAAIDRLARPATPAKPDATKQPGTAAASKASDAQAPDAKPTDEGLKNRTVDDLDATPEERARWKRGTAERFDRVLSAARTARQELEKVAPFVERGREYSKVLDDFGLHQDIGFVPPEHFAGVVKAQAAINRALIAIDQGRQPAPGDLATFETLAANVDRLREQLGVKPKVTASTAAPAAIAPFTGELPQDLRDLVDVYGIDEKRVRLLAALEKSAAALQPPVQPSQQQQPVHPTPAPVVQPAQPRPVGVDMDQLYGRKLVSELSAAGVQNPAEHVRVLLRHPQTRQEVIRRFPGITVADVPQVFDSLDAATRYDILKSAHAALTAHRVPARSTPPPPATTNRALPVTAAPRKAAPDANGDPVAAAIALLARE